MMRNFVMLADGVPVEPLLAEIDSVPGVWDRQTGRQRIRVQREAKAIPLRGLRKSRIQGRARRDVHESRFTTLSRSFPLAIDFIRSWAAKLDADLARARIVSLPPGQVVYDHVDRGEYYARRNRYHLVLQAEQSWMRCGDEVVSMSPGELWWFDNKLSHEARNEGSIDRIHMIFDLEPRDGLLGHRDRIVGDPSRIGTPVLTDSIGPRTA
ncbi:MAG: aspartyl/asparaginyl beta-hydroxylase domain-containing protein [Spirochaetaceae bacterium]|nr:aspartyl/asparaginyl beta-hydroxylase domain-containing protein [Myxococcales bacterium]MCB9723808.1 aspartyl/asparaginyl beta-hydroxylase domain-containing protein [Spirochaetaceae bacterium]HPG23995.1 aspartyl/asparaginyl beta-hydroxylase domain-containing protein [Myxococcota bacterium]